MPGIEPIIQAKLRTAFGKQTRKLRRSGFIPAVVYGKGKTTQALQVLAKEFENLYKAVKESALVNLKIEGEGERKVLVHDVAKHFMHGTPIHVDFYEVDLKRKIHAKVPLHFVGTSPAVKELGGVLVKNLNEIEVEALPTDLPQSLEVNIETLKTFDDHVRIGDLKPDSNVKILGHAEDVLVSVKPPRTEAELAELEKPTAEAEKAAIEGMEVEALKKEEVAPEAKAEEAVLEKKPEKPEAKEK